MNGRWGAGWLGRVAAAAALGLFCLGTTGCSYFFVCDKSSCTNSGSGTTTNNSGDYAYVSTGSSGNVAAYNVGSGALTAITGSPFPLGFVPVAMKVSPNNSFLYVGAADGNIYAYTISSAGALSSSGLGLLGTTASGTLSAIDISPDGAFLYAVDQAGIFLYQYTLSTSTGKITGTTNFSLPGTAGCVPSGTPASQSCSVAVSPVSNGSGYVAVALGASGTVVYPYTTAGGMTQTTAGVIACCNSVVASPSGDFSLAFDSSDYLYISRTLTLSSYGSVNTVSPTNTGNISYASGVTPRSVTMFSSYKYLYTANKGNGTINGFTLAGSGGLNAVSGSPFTGPTEVAALGADNTGVYLVAVGYNASTGVQLFKPSAGVLGSAVATVGTGTDATYPALVAMTH